MAHWLDRLGELLLDASLSATVLLSLVALAMIGCRQPVRRIYLARAAILGVLALIPLVFFAPFPRIAIDRTPHESGLFWLPVLSYGDRPVPVKSVPSDRPLRRLSCSTPAQAPSTRGWVAPLPRWLVVIDLAATGAALGWLLFGYWGLRWLTSHSHEPSPQSAELYQTLPTPGRRPRLRINERVRRPVLVGLVRQTILIPGELDLPESADPLRLSLLHELAHAERGDSWFGLASNLAQAFWFFLPPLWWIRSQMRLDQEFMADRRAASAFGPIQNYAASLVKIAGRNPELQPSIPAPRARPGGRASALFLRVLMLVQCPFSVESRPPRWWSCSLPSLVLLGMMAVSCLTLRVPEVAPAVANPKPTTPRSFCMARLVADPSAAHMEPPRVHELPIAIPDSFDLKFEVWGDADSLAQTKVIGIRLRDPEPRSPEAPPPLPGWHRVRIHRDANALTVRIDQLSLPVDPQLKTSASLRFETPVDYPAHFRALRLTW